MVAAAAAAAGVDKGATGGTISTVVVMHHLLDAKSEAIRTGVGIGAEATEPETVVTAGSGRLNVYPSGQSLNSPSLI